MIILINMKELKIVKDSNPLLRNKSIDVTLPINKEDEETILTMMKYLKKSQDPQFRESHPNVREGIGLAAPQIGVLKKMLVIHFFKEGEEVAHALVNPKILSSSVKKCYLKNGEGCLSVDNPHEGLVFRDFKIKVKAYDAIKKKDVEIIARGLEAIVLQHEIDHLYGILFYDHINKMNPNFAPEEFIAL